MKTVSIQMEGALLVTALNPKFTGYILTRVNDNDFGFAEGSEIFTRIKKIVRSGRKLPSREDFSEDPALSEDACAVIRKSKPYRKEDEVDQCIKTLDDYRRRRIAHDATGDIVGIMKDNGDVEEIFKTMEGAIRNARVRDEIENRLLDFGASADVDHANDLLADRMSRKKDLNIIKSGFRNFDSVSGGYSRGHLCILGASRGSGKTSLAVQKALNFYDEGLSVAFIELEMSDAEAYDRIMANKTGIDSLKIRRHDLSPQEANLLSREHRKLHRLGRKRNCRFTTYPVARVTSEEIDTRIGHLGYDVIIIDYLGMIDPSTRSNKPTHEIKAEITRDMKALAKTRDCLVILLVQLTDDLRVKYSRAVEDHVDWFWGWRLTDEARDLNVTRIRQNKARHAPEFNFLLRFDLSTSTWVDYKGTDPFTSESSGDGERVRHGGRRGGGERKVDDGYDVDSMRDL